VIFGGPGGRPENAGWVAGFRSGTASLIHHRGNQQYGIGHERAYIHEGALAEIPGDFSLARLSEG
jgi:hypothetical protein